MKAFPYIEQIGIQDVAGYKGMDLRDYFAAKAMQGLFSNPALFDSGTGKFHEENFITCYQAADAMMKARKQ